MPADDAWQEATPLNLLRGGGKPEKKNDLANGRQAAIKAVDDQKKAKQKVAAPKLKPPQTPKPMEDGSLIQQHWDVPVMHAQQMKHGVEGVCPANEANLKTMYEILRGTPSNPAILVPMHAEIGLDHQIIIVWVKIGDDTKQATRKLVQAGTAPVQYNPPASKGSAIKTEHMTSIVLEIVRKTHLTRRRIGKRQ